MRLSEKRKLKVMLVDDNSEFVELAASLFEFEGFEVVKSTEVSRAIKLLRTREVVVDAIVSDFNMPGLSGMDFLKEVLALDRSIPFFFLTATSELTDTDARKAGAERLFKKPGSISQIATAIRISFSGRCNFRENEIEDYKFSS